MTSTPTALAYRDVINYTCANDQSFEDHSIADVKSATCGVDGVWYPSLVLCTGKLSCQEFICLSSDTHEHLCDIKVNQI